MSPKAPQCGFFQECRHCHSGPGCEAGILCLLWGLGPRKEALVTPEDLSCSPDCLWDVHQPLLAPLVSHCEFHALPTKKSVIREIKNRTKRDRATCSEGCEREEVDFLWRDPWKPCISVSICSLWITRMLEEPLSESSLLLEILESFS